MSTSPSLILVAEDDADDRLLLQSAFEESRLPHELHFVPDGEVLLEYLRGRGRFGGTLGAPWPDLVLLDLNMPRKDGREALQEIKSDARLRRIPVVVLTTSRAPEDVTRSYDLGVNSVIRKPDSFEGLVSMVLTLGRYWFDLVEISPRA